MSLRTCSGLDAGIELKVGRIDATEAGPTGVPEAFTVCRRIENLNSVLMYPTGPEYNPGNF